MNEYVQQFSRSASDIIDGSVLYKKSFRTWGPENRFKDRDCIGNPEGKGPCRMLQCICRNVHDDEQVIEDWYTGQCDTCNKYIANISHSVRYPHENGGWKGCFCSFECIIQKPPYQMKTRDNERLNNVKQKIKEVGIMDRSLL